MSVVFTSMNRLNADIAQHLNKRGLYRESIRVSQCHGYKQCHCLYCIHCASLRVYKQRLHLTMALSALLAQHPKAQVWFLTGATEDSDDINAYAKAAVRGMRRLLKHPRLRNRLIAHFSVLEVALKRHRTLPCAHVHTLAVTKPMDKGRYRISECDWILIWEAVCPLARKRDCSIPLKRRHPKKSRKHASFVAIMAGTSAADLKGLIRYCTKWATPRNITRNYRQMLLDPDRFIHRIDALKGVTRFFGPLHFSAQAKQSKTQARIQPASWPLLQPRGPLVLKSAHVQHGAGVKRRERLTNPSSTPLGAEIFNSFALGAQRDKLRECQK